jgi:hypothetical protein
MDSDRPGKEPRPPAREQRRSGRFPVIVPVEAKWQIPGNEPLQEGAEAVEVNLHGAVLRMKALPPIGTILELTNRSSGETAQARVVAHRGSRLKEVAVELLISSETFWGITFRLKRTTTELHALEEDIQSGGADPRVLREFRDAVDYIRKTAWVVYEWQERQLRHKDAATVLSLLLSERLRRATQLNEDIAKDLDACQVARNTPRIPELLAAVEGLAQRLRTICGSTEGV